MFSENCINHIRRLRLYTPKVECFFTESDEAFRHSMEGISVRTIYRNYTKEAMCLLMPSGLIYRIEPEKTHNAALMGKFIILEKQCFQRKEGIISVHVPTEKDQITQAMNALVNVYKNDIDRFEANDLVWHLADYDDIVAEEDGFLFPATMVTVYPASCINKIKNKALSTMFDLVDNESAGGGKQFRFISREKRSRIYLSFANTVIPLDSIEKDVDFDFVEVYRTDKGGKVTLTGTIKLEDMLKGESDVKAFRNEADANIHTEKLTGAGKDQKALLAELNKTKDLLETEKLNHRITKKRSLDETERSKATVWTKISAALGSVGSILASIWTMVTRIF